MRRGLFFLTAAAAAATLAVPAAGEARPAAHSRPIKDHCVAKRIPGVRGARITVCYPTA